jgi:hypothetical protein
MELELLFLLWQHAAKLSLFTNFETRIEPLYTDQREAALKALSIHHGKNAPPALRLHFFRE